MKNNTLQIITGALAGDDSIDDAAKKKILAATHEKQIRRTWLTTAEAAKLLGCSKMSIWRYEQNGYLHPVRRSARCKRFDEAEVLHLLNHGIQKGGAA